jgi:hypothetical protein
MEDRNLLADVKSHNRASLDTDRTQPLPVGGQVRLYDFFARRFKGKDFSALLMMHLFRT